MIVNSRVNYEYNNTASDFPQIRSLSQEWQTPSCSFPKLAVASLPMGRWGTCPTWVLEILFIRQLLPA